MNKNVKANQFELRFKDDYMIRLNHKNKICQFSEYQCIIYEVQQSRAVDIIMLSVRKNGHLINAQ